MSAPEPQAGRFSDRAIAWGLFGAAFAALLLTQRQVGFPRDESVYFYAGESYAGWFKLLLSHPSAAMTDSAILRSFSYNAEHPGLMKVLFGLSFWLFHETLKVLEPAAAFRLPAFAAAAMIPALLYRFGAGLFGRPAGLFAALSFLLVPRHAFNAELAAFDVPVAAFWLLTVYFFWRAQSQPRAWIWCGVALGLALATKHNGFFLPLVLGPFALVRALQVTEGDRVGRERVWQIIGAFSAAVVLYAVLVAALGPVELRARFTFLSPQTAIYLGLVAGCAYLLRKLHRENLAAFRALAPVASMAVLGPLVLYLAWPLLWFHPVDRVAQWIAFHLNHEHYAWFYLGKLLRQPPFPLEYVLVKTALTVPTAIFVPMVIGFGVVLGRGVLALIPATRPRVRPASFDEWLVLANATLSIAVISMPNVPHFGGVKHWIPSMLFLGLLAGDSVSRSGRVLYGLLSSRVPRRAAWVPTAALSALLLVPSLIALVRVFPYGTAYYSELAGGLPGAASLGMQRQFWSSHVTGVLPWINAHAPPGARIWFHELIGPAMSVRDYQRNGLLRRDIVPVHRVEDAQISVYQYHQEFRENEFNIWQQFGTTKPVTGLYLDETPQIIVYQRP